MSILGVINTEPEVEAKIREAFKKRELESYDLRFMKEDNEITEFINYGLSELVVVNFSDSQVEIDKIVNHIKANTWILSFGIVGIFDQKKDKEEDLLSRLRNLNILTLLEYCRIQSHIAKCVEVIRKNHQIIFQHELTRNFFKGSSGSFAIENDILVVPLFAGIGVTLLSQHGVIDSEKKMLLQLALSELIVNGVEHGNCSISYEEKTEGMANGLSVVEMVQERCKDPKIAAKRVCLDWEVQKDWSQFTIRDEGEGFDVAAHLDKTRKQNKMSLHGRGIRMAFLADKNLSYNDKGNEVTLRIPHALQTTQEVPVGFSHEDVLNTKRGDIIFAEGAKDDYLYYIASGIFSVFYKKKLVGLLSMRDIFMGEMSFLLNENRTATVRAETPGKLIRLTRKSFVSVVRKHPHYGILLSKLLAERLIRSNSRNATGPEDADPSD